MTVRTYRAQVAGQFDRPGPPVRTRLLDEQPEHDLRSAVFSKEGTFTYTPTLTRFTFRYLIGIEADSAAEADGLAALEAEVRAIDYLASLTIPFKNLTTTTTCLDDVKIKRPQLKRRDSRQDREE
ncbi:DUF6204 family protein [Streptomyces sp. NPDC001292]|uniref:DUF6204 family protein n=1 Tax=Streptomyces sp. NPDC001292 TaxID=3364558 RepID=UPI00368AA186